ENEAEMADPAHLPREDGGRICDMGTRREATIEDLYNVAEDGKAEIVNGEIFVMGPVAYPHGHASMEIVLSLREYGRRTKLGRAIPDPVAFTSTFRIADRFVLTPRSTSARRSVENSLRARRFLPWRCAAVGIMVPLPNGGWPPSERTISPPARG